MNYVNSEIGEYFPLVSISEKYDKYVRHHLVAHKKCVDERLFSSAAMHLHLLFMAWVYTQLFRLSRLQSREFELMVGVSGVDLSLFINPEDPFAYSRISERTVFGFFRVIGLPHQMIGDMKKCIDTRNKEFHASGNLAVELEEDYSRRNDEYFTYVSSICKAQIPILVGEYQKVCELDILNEPGYEITSDDLELNLIRPLLCSQEEIRFFIELNNKSKLHNALALNYG